MKSCKLLYAVSFCALLSGCATELVSPGYEDHPNLKAAEMARARGDVPQAIHDYRDIIKENPKCEKAYIGLGMSLLDTNNVDEAKKTFDQGIAMFPNSPGMWIGLGSVYLTIDQPENAILAFEKALCLDPRRSKALNGLGIAEDMMGEHVCAQANYRAAMEIEGNNPSYESNLALSMALSGNTAEAIRILERLVSSPCATPRMRQNLSLAYGLAGDMKRAKDIGKVDLPPNLVKENITYFESVVEARDNAGFIPLSHTVPMSSARKMQNQSN